MKMRKRQEETSQHSEAWHDNDNNRPTARPTLLHTRPSPSPLPPLTCSCACTSPKPVAVEAMAWRPEYLMRIGTSRPVACTRTHNRCNTMR